MNNERAGVQPLRLARAADHALPVLLVLLLIALTTSITAVGVLIALLIVATLLRLTDPGLRARHRAPLALPMLAFAFLTLLSAAGATHRAVAFFESKHLVSLALFFVAVNGFQSSAQIRRALGWFFGAVSLVSLYAILQTWACATSIDLPGWVAWALRVKLETCRATVPFRAKGFFSIYMTLGGSLLIALSLLFATLALAPRRRALGVIPPTALAFVALGLTYVRNAWLGLVTALAVLGLLTRRFALILPVALAVLAALTVPSALRPKLLSIFDPSSESARERFYFWDAGRRMVKDAPLFGLGPGGVRMSYPQYKHPDARKPRTGHLHNNLVQIAAERGLLGLAAWLWIWTTFLLQTGRIYHTLPPTRGDDRALVAGSLAAVGGFLVAGLFEYNFGDSEVIDLLLVVMAFPFVVAREVAAEVADPLAPNKA